MDTKEIKITGNAAEVQMGGGKRRRSRKANENADVTKAAGQQTRKQVGGAAAQAAAPVVPTTVAAPQPAPTTGAKIYPEQSVPAPALQGGAKTKVILEPAKKHAAHLAPPAHKKKSNQTRKARKIRVSLTGLGKRMTRHKTIQKESRAVSLDEIKKTLVAAKLIKMESKAPESMLRTMYADYQTLKKKAL
jgi:hypothetical protein